MVLLIPSRGPPNLVYDGKEIESTLPDSIVQSALCLVNTPTTEWIAKFLGRDNGSRCRIFIEDRYVDRCRLLRDIGSAARDRNMASAVWYLRLSVAFPTLCFPLTRPVSRGSCGLFV